MRSNGILLAILAIAAIALSVSGLLTMHAVHVDLVPPDTAEARFAAVRDSVATVPPLFHRDASGKLVRSTERVGTAQGSAASPLARGLHVLAYRAKGHKLLRADIPFWFLRMKGPAVTLVLRGTGVDLKALGLRPIDLQRAGVGLVLDERRADGDRALIWTE